MSVLKLSTYLIILFVTVGFGLQIYSLSESLQSGKLPFVKLSDESKLYLAKLDGDLVENEDGLQLEDVAGITEGDMYNDTYFGTEEDDGGTTISDVLASVNLNTNVLDKFMKPVKFVTNAPTFYLLLFNMDVSYFGGWTYAWNLFFYIILGLLIKREITG